MPGSFAGHNKVAWVQRASSPWYVLTALWIGVYLIWGSLLTHRLWLHGWHTTPEQWAYHALMEQLGIPHHHGYVDDEPRSSPDGSAAATARRSDGPDLVAAQMVALAGPADGSSMLAATMGALVVGLGLTIRLVRRRPSTATRFPDPPEPPPPTILCS